MRHLYGGAAEQHHQLLSRVVAAGALVFALASVRRSRAAAPSTLFELLAGVAARAVVAGGRPDLEPAPLEPSRGRQRGGDLAASSHELMDMPVERLARRTRPSRQVPDRRDPRLGPSTGKVSSGGGVDATLARRCRQPALRQTSLRAPTCPAGPSPPPSQTHHPLAGQRRCRLAPDPPAADPPRAAFGLAR